jgi:hypothetical protein
MGHVLGIIRTHVDNCYWQGDNHCYYNHLFVTNRCLRYFTLNLHEIFNYLQKKLNKSFVLLFKFYFVCVFLVSENLVSKYK